MQNVSTAKSSKTIEALGGFEPPISCLQDRRSNHYATEPCNRELSSTSLPDRVTVKKPKETMTIKSMQNVPRAKNSKIIEALGGSEPPISCLQDKKNNHYASEPY